jgi:ribosomal protein L37AE/L43A
MAKTCPKCQAKAMRGAKHCMKCGAALTGESKQPTTEGKPKEETKHEEQRPEDFDPLEKLWA